MKSVIFLIAAVFCSITGFSQNNQDKGVKKLKFGFNMGTNYSNLKSKEILANYAQIYNDYGIKVGVLMDYFLSENMLLSPKAELSFNKSGVDFTNNDDSKTTYKVFPITLNIMTHFSYKIGKGKMIPYLLAGPNFKLPINNNSESTTDFKNNADVAFDFGIGLENKLSQFIFAPELRYSLGLLNINEHPGLQSLNYHSISLVFNFK